VADAAAAHGASVLAITAGHSPLARRADVALLVDPLDDAQTPLALVGRILQLLMLDILAVGIATRPRADGAASERARTSSHGR
jgi:glucokinase